MNVGEAARASGVSAKMIRYYESIGVIARVARATNGYRRYTETDVHTLRFVRRARSLGFPIEVIRRLVALWRDPRRSSADVKRLAQAHLVELQHKIAELQSMTQALQHLVGHCRGDHRPECPIIDDLVGGERSPGTRRNAALGRRASHQAAARRATNGGGI